MHSPSADYWGLVLDDSHEASGVQCMLRLRQAQGRLRALSSSTSKQNPGVFPHQTPGN